MTLDDKSALAKHRPSGFDYLRVILAVSVVSWHTVVITYGSDFQETIWASPAYRLLITGILPAFFALSGFLVAGSLERSKTLVGFLYLRAIRIFPALIVEIAVSALILGPLLTTRSLPDYFTSPEFYRYFLNCFGDVHYLLPGVFETNPLPFIVNGQLWTVPYELECYILLSVVAFTGIILHRKLFALFVAAIVAYCVYKFAAGTPLTAGPLTGRTLVACFLVGVFLYMQRDRIPYDARWGTASIVASLVCFSTPHATYLLPLPIAYATVFIGLTNPAKPRLMDSGDYSYGIFLYGFPIQQTVVAIGRSTNGWVNCFVAMPFILAVAFLSWHLWERHFIPLKKYRKNLDAIFVFTRPGFVADRLGRVIAWAR